MVGFADRAAGACFKLEGSGGEKDGEQAKRTTLIRGAAEPSVWHPVERRAGFEASRVDPVEGQIIILPARILFYNFVHNCII